MLALLSALQLAPAVAAGPWSASAVILEYLQGWLV